MPNDKEIKVGLKLEAQGVKSAEDVKNVLVQIEDRLRQIENAGEDSGFEDSIDNVRKKAESIREKLSTPFAEGEARAGDYTEGLLEVVNALGEVDKAQLDVAKSAETIEGNTEKVADYIRKAQEAAEALEEKAKAADKVGEKLNEINIAQHIQLAGQFATGLRSLSRIAKDSGQEELADGLKKSADAMDVVAGAAAGGLNLSKIIKAAGGARAALGKVAAFLTGPMGIALAAAAAAWWAINAAVEHYSEISDRALESNAKGAVTLGTSLDEEKAARDRAAEAADKYLQILRDINTERENGRANISSAARIELAELDARKNEILERIKAAEDLFKRTGGNSGLSPAQAELRRKQVGDIADREGNRIRSRARRNDLRLKGGEVSGLDGELDLQRRTIREYENIIRDLQSKGNLSDEERKALSDVRARAEKAKSDGKDQDEVAKILEEGLEILTKANKPTKDAILQALQKVETAKAKAEKLEVELKRATEELKDLKRSTGEQQALDDIDTGSRGRIRSSQTDSKLRNIAESNRAKKQRDADRERKQREDLEKDAVGEAQGAAGLIGNTPEARRFKAATDAAAAKLGDGIQGNEFSVFVDGMEKVANAVDIRDEANRIQLQQALRRLQSLEAKLKNQKPAR